MIKTAQIQQISTLSNRFAHPFAEVIKLGEELGELNAAILVADDSPNKSRSATGNVLEEGCDVLMCVLNIIYQRGYTDEDINEMVSRKNTKWGNKLHAHQESLNANS